MLRAPRHLPGLLLLPLPGRRPEPARDEFKGHPAFEYTAQFCHLYDQNSFDPAYDTMPLEAFEPMLHRVCAQPKRMMMAPAKAGA